jgi:hypothetical protein
VLSQKVGQQTVTNSNRPTELPRSSQHCFPARLHLHSLGYENMTYAIVPLHIKIIGTYTDTVTRRHPFFPRKCSINYVQLITEDSIQLSGNDAVRVIEKTLTAFKRFSK